MDLSQEDKEHRVKVLINEPKAMAKQRLMDFAANLPVDEEGDYDNEDNYVVTRRGEPVTYTELIERAREYQEEFHQESMSNLRTAQNGQERRRHYDCNVPPINGSSCFTASLCRNCR